jgi:hypothetical protein
MQMSIYSQSFITFVSKLLRSSLGQREGRFFFKLVKGFKFGRQVLLLHPVCLPHLPLHGHLPVLRLVGGGYVNSDNDS